VVILVEVSDCSWLSKNVFIYIK